MQAFLSLLLRLALVAIGLVAAAAFAVVFGILLAAWLLRSAWGRLTGRPVAPFGMRFGTRRAFEGMMRRAQAGAGTRTRRADVAVGRRARLADVTDVEPK